MNKLILALTLSLASIPCIACSDSISFAPDKQKHFVGSAGIGLLSEVYFEDKASAFVTTLSIGLTKEIYDKVSGKGCASGYDMLYNAIGAGVGIYTGSWFITPNKIVYFKEF